MASSFHWQYIFNTSLKAYERKTKSDVRNHPLAAQLQTCNSPDAFLVILRNLLDQQFSQRHTSDGRLKKWFDPTMNVLYAFSDTLGEGLGLVSPKSLSFYYVCSDDHPLGILLWECDISWYRRPYLCERPLRSLNISHHDASISHTAKDVNAGQDMLIDLFERIERFFRRLESYIERTLSEAMTNILVDTIVEVLSVLATVTVGIKQKRWSQFITSNFCVSTQVFLEKSLKKLLSRNDVVDALKRLDKLNLEEAMMATAEVLKGTRNVDDSVKMLVDDGIQREFSSRTNCPDGLYRQMTRRQEPWLQKKKTHQIITLRSTLTMREQPPGFFRVVCLKSRDQRRLTSMPRLTKGRKMMHAGGNRRSNDLTLSSPLSTSFEYVVRNALHVCP